jgi:hypothetical protein
MFDALVTAQPSIKVHGGFQTRLEAKHWASDNALTMLCMAMMFTFLRRTA